jgi:hypothetical protein
MIPLLRDNLPGSDDPCGPASVNGGNEPVPMSAAFAVLFTRLQDAIRIRAKLSSIEYYDLITEIWKYAEEVFKRHNGNYVKHTRDSIYLYFVKDCHPLSISSTQFHLPWI